MQVVYLGGEENTGKGVRQGRESSQLRGLFINSSTAVGDWIDLLSSTNKHPNFFSLQSNHKMSTLLCLSGRK